jgi:hypothetical protein
MVEESFLEKVGLELGFGACYVMVEMTEMEKSRPGRGHSVTTGAEAGQNGL